MIDIEGFSNLYMTLLQSLLGEDSTAFTEGVQALVSALEAEGDASNASARAVMWVIFLRPCNSGGRRS